MKLKGIIGKNQEHKEMFETVCADMRLDLKEAQEACKVADPENVSVNHLILLAAQNSLFIQLDFKKDEVSLFYDPAPLSIKKDEADPEEPEAEKPAEEQTQEGNPPAQTEEAEAEAPAPEVKSEEAPAEGPAASTEEDEDMPF